jgi:hypothetical protein
MLSHPKKRTYKASFGTLETQLFVRRTVTNGVEMLEKPIIDHIKSLTPTSEEKVDSSQDTQPDDEEKLSPKESFRNTPSFFKKKQKLVRTSSQILATFKETIDDFFKEKILTGATDKDKSLFVVQLIFQLGRLYAESKEIKSIFPQKVAGTYCEDKIEQKKEKSKKNNQEFNIMFVDQLAIMTYATTASLLKLDNEQILYPKVLKTLDDFRHLHPLLVYLSKRKQLHPEVEFTKDEKNKLSGLENFLGLQPYITLYQDIIDNQPNAENIIDEFNFKKKIDEFDALFHEKFTENVKNSLKENQEDKLKFLQEFLKAQADKINFNLPAQQSDQLLKCLLYKLGSFILQDLMALIKSRSNEEKNRLAERFRSAARELGYIKPDPSPPAEKALSLHRH